ncbi:peptidylprolyl isomerase [Thiomicrorhabdus heinhorstiae]|uniref:peptidylprolyl isomerase n=2 Tax=Thiomicrorhabdus TaxID=2039723 RepID=A0ABS0BTR7_9GAMM|nr:peptidylprolyl isomerase [Thiomicrorhabdus heinhorstiae]
MAADAVTVNGVKIPDSLVESYIQQLPPEKRMNKDEVINELIIRQLLVQDAEKKGLDKSPQVQEKIQQVTNNILVSEAVKAYQQTHPITETELKEAYKEIMPQLEASRHEYHASHILVKTEDEAKALIDELKKGADFTQLAKDRSTGPSAKNGGELGWFKANQMVPEFTSAVAKLNKGEYTTSPVQTQFGWHVIKLEDTRSDELPTLEKIKPQLTRFIEQKNIQEYIQSLQSQAKITK